MVESTLQTTRTFTLPEKTGVLFELKSNPNSLQEVIKLKLHEKKQVSHNSFIFSFEFPNKDMALGLQVGQHIAIDQDIVTEEFPEGEPITRKYTPISWITQKGTVDILMKIYPKTTKFPDGGKLTLWINELKIGDTIDVRGPFGKYQYLGDGWSQILIKFNPPTYDKRQFKKIGMLGAGTGIAPLYQILNGANINGEDESIEFTLFYGNSTEKDILLKAELEDFVKQKRFNFKLILMINNLDEGWTGEVGHFNEDNIKKYMPEPSDEAIILHCGTRSLCREVYNKVLFKLGHKQENVFEF